MKNQLHYMYKRPERLDGLLHTHVFISTNLKLSTILYVVFAMKAAI